MIVVLELCQQKQLIPVILPLVDKEAEILFQLLVGSLLLPITLQMVGHSGSQHYAKEVVAAHVSALLQTADLGQK